MRIIVALDIIEGKCVRLEKGDFSTKKVYNADPWEMARQIEDNGLKYLHLVDLEGAEGIKNTSFRLLEKIASRTTLQVDFGGGLRSSDDVRAAFESGAAQVTCGSLAVTDRPLFTRLLENWGNDKIILGADCMNHNVVIHGWTESSPIEINAFIKSYVANGIRYIICTDIEKDGMLAGPATDLYKEILRTEKIFLIASGGISSLGDMEKLAEIGCEGAIVGKALYEGIIKLNELSRLC